MEYGHVYSFTAVIIPKWVKLSRLEIEAPINAAGDCPRSYIKIVIEGTQLSGVLKSEKPFDNGGTLWNVIEAHSKAVIDTVAFINAAKVDLYVDSIRDESCNKQLQLDSIARELAEILKKIEITFTDISNLMCDRRYEYHIRHALFHARQALLEPGETVLSGYRAVETLMNYFVDASGIPRQDNGRPPTGAWDAFRGHYGIDEQVTRRLAELSHPLRHGNYPAAHVLDGATRKEILEDVWNLIGIFIKAECQHANRQPI